ncbi:integrase catalytic domain-containing protein [Trichonephila clavata]|uniref:Integrase catalytic domain-containing protein n=1 Tax=Trichonephila clavata TaxID=2740835 RepID=A0A8X6JCK5_TRICU|nr:integrase catalytic domain-containing protein [Trichonephila clavata]
MRQCVQFSLSSVWNKNSVLITAFGSSNKYTSHPAAPADIVRFAKSQKLILADPPEDSNLPIELLISGDFYWHVVTTKSPIKVEDYFVMIPSIFGWVLSGSRIHTTITHDPEVHHVSVQISSDHLDIQVQCSWELGFIGIIDTQIKSKTVREKEIMAEFSKTYQTEDNR